MILKAEQNPTDVASFFCTLQLLTFFSIAYFVQLRKKYQILCLGEPISTVRGTSYNYRNFGTWNKETEDQWLCLGVFYNLRLKWQLISFDIYGFYSFSKNPFNFCTFCALEPNMQKHQFSLAPGTTFLKAMSYLKIQIRVLMAFSEVPQCLTSGLGCLNISEEKKNQNKLVQSSPRILSTCNHCTSPF